MLALPALLFLVGIGAVGLYLALPRGPESETRSVRLAGAALGVVSLSFLALATRGSLPEWEDSRLSRLPGSLLFHSLALVTLVSGSAAVTERSVFRGGVAVGVLLAAAGGLAGIAGLPWVGGGLGLLAAAAGAVIVIRGRHVRSPADGGVFDDQQRRPRELEFSREPLLACAAGALLATGLLAAGHAAVVAEVPLTAEVERNVRPPSQRYRSFPRNSVVEAIAGEGSTDGERQSQRRNGDFAGDLPLLHRLLTVAGLLFAVGIVGLLTRRSVWSCGMSAVTALLAVVLVVAALASLPFRAGRSHLALLTIAVLAAEIGLLVLAGRRKRSSEAPPGVAADSAMPGGPP